MEQAPPATPVQDLRTGVPLYMSPVLPRGGGASVDAAGATSGVLPPRNTQSGSAPSVPVKQAARVSNVLPDASPCSVPAEAPAAVAVAAPLDAPASTFAAPASGRKVRSGPVAAVHTLGLPPPLPAGAGAGAGAAAGAATGAAATVLTTAQPLSHRQGKKKHVRVPPPPSPSSSSRWLWAAAAAAAAGVVAYTVSKRRR